MTYREELEEKLDEIFPKGKSRARVYALMLFAYAVLLHEKYVNKIFDDQQRKVESAGGQTIKNYSGK